MMCDKRSYPTKREALQARRWCEQQRERGDLRRQEKRIYKCQVCGAYHLTSSEHWDYDLLEA